MKNFEIEDGVLIRYTGHDTVVRIPDSVTSIGEHAFYGYERLTSVTIPNGVMSIGDGAFAWCSALTNVEIPNSVTSIGKKAFMRCLALKNINIPNSVTRIGVNAFWGCETLKFKEYNNGLYLGNKENPYAFLIEAKSEHITTCEIKETCKCIEDSAFCGCIGLTKIVVGNNIQHINSRTFYCCGIKHKPKDNIAYKGFNADMTCRNFQYEEGKTYTCNKSELCEYGFHACLNPLDCFNYYFGEDAVYHEVILEDRTKEFGGDSKTCGKKITIGRRLAIHEMFSIFNELNKE